MHYLLLSLAFVPLIVVNSLIYPYVSGKVLLIRVVATAVLLLLSFRLFNTEFRTNAIWRLKALFKDKLFLSVLAYFSFFTLSTVFAYDKIRAFAGTPERGEGFVGIFFFIVAFVLFLLLFDKKYWQWFFKLTLLAGLILFIHQLMMSNVLNGIHNFQSLIGNRGFFAIYFLFMIFSGLIVWRNSQIFRDRFWLYFSGMMIPLSVVTVFIPDKKGPLASLAAGLFAFLIYLLIRQKKFRKLILTGLIFMLVFGGLFFATRSAKIWQEIPGFRKVARASFLDQTISARMVSAGISLDAVNPRDNGLKNLLLGWGWDNYLIAWYKNYNPQIYNYEPKYLDRSHNKLLDVLTMNGVLGLLAYLSIWFLFFKQFLRKTVGEEITRQGLFKQALPGKDVFIEAAMFFFGVSYFVQNIYTFDQISTYISFLTLLAFSIFYFNPVRDSRASGPEGTRNSIASASSNGTVVCVWLISAFALIFLIFFTVIPMIQMKQFLTLGDPEKREGVLTNDFIFSRYMYADFEIRKIFISSMIGSQITDLSTLRYLDRAILKTEEGLDSINGKLYPDYMTFLATGYEKRGAVTGDKSWYEKSDDMFNKAVELAPNYQPTYFDYAGSLVVQGRSKEAEEMMRKALSINPDSPTAQFNMAVFLIFQPHNKDSEAMEHIQLALSSDYFVMDDQSYSLIGQIAKYFYDNNQSDNFMKIFDLLSKFKPEEAGPYYLELYNRNADYVRTNGRLPEKFEFY